MKKIPAINHKTRILAATVLAAASVLVSLPAPVKADPNPVDLELDAAGSTPIIANNLQPGDSGTKTVTIRNAGTSDGYVSIWLSDIITGEGINPESETDTTGSGEMDEYFLLDISVDGLTTSLDLPAPVKDLPASATGREYIDIIPLKAGETKTLDWLWELPAETGNEIQGDELSFSINYLLRETEIADISGNISPGGEFTSDIVVYSENKNGNIRIAANTTGKTAGNQTPSDIWLIEKQNVPPSPSGNRTIAGHYYNAGPDGMTFDKPLTLTLAYNPGAVPAGVSESQLYIALWDKTAGDWIPLPGCTVDTATKTVSVQVTHFSRYTVLAPESPVPEEQPPDTTPGDIPAIDDETEEAVILEVKLLDEKSAVEISGNGILKESVTITSSDGMFTLELPEGTRITGTGGIALSRIELVIEEINPLLPENTVLLTPAYRLVGYDREGKTVNVEFSPAVRLTIRYNPLDLPENSFSPFIATYSDEAGLVRLESPVSFPFSLGRVDTLISGSDLFVVAVEVAPPPQPLPAFFTAGNLVVSPLTAFEGDPITISVTITNEGSATGTHELYLIIDGVVREIREVTLGGKSYETLTFEISNLAAGTHQIKTAGLTASVKIEQVVIQPMGSGVNWLVLDLGVGGVIICGLVIWVLYMRRARRRESYL